MILGRYISSLFLLIQSNQNNIQNTATCIKDQVLTQHTTNDSNYQSFLYTFQIWTSCTLPFFSANNLIFHTSSQLYHELTWAPKYIYIASNIISTQKPQDCIIENFKKFPKDPNLFPIPIIQSPSNLMYIISFFLCLLLDCSKIIWIFFLQFL